MWWLYDDGGLTLLIPYILTTRSQLLSMKRSPETSLYLLPRQQFSECQLRVFSLASRKDELDRETRSGILSGGLRPSIIVCPRNMAALLAKFRIDFSSVLVIDDVTKRAGEEARTRLATKLAEVTLIDLFRLTTLCPVTRGHHLCGGAGHQ